MSLNLPVLYSFRRCPYAMRARLALLYSNIKCHLREVDLKEKPQSLLEYSPKGTVPVLILDDGKIIDESMDIIDYALQHSDPNGLLQLNLNQINEVEELINNNDNNFTPLLRRYKYHERYPESPQKETLEEIQQHFLQKYETRLTEHSFLVTDIMSKADIALFPFMRQFALADEEWFKQSSYHNIARWLKFFTDSQWFDDAMVRLKPWQQGDSNLTLDSNFNHLTLNLKNSK